MNNFDDILSPEEIKLMATYIQMEPPIPPEMSISLMRERLKTYVDQRTTRPSRCTAATGKISSWSSSVMPARWPSSTATSTKIVAHVPTGYAVHVLKAAEHHNMLKSENPGRFWYTMGRDGKTDQDRPVADAGQDAGRRGPGCL